MNAMILAAGLGARMRPYSHSLPKPLFPVRDKTLLELSMENVMAGGADRIVVNVHHLAGRIETFLETRKFLADIIVSREREILGTAGGIKHAEKWLKTGGDFLVMNSDIIAAINWESIIHAHKDRNAIATLALREYTGPENYSAISIDTTGAIVGFPGAGCVNKTCDGKRYMFTGVSVVSPRIFGFIPPDEPFDIAKQVYAPMVERGGQLYGFVINSPWRDAGTIAHYHTAVMEALRVMPSADSSVTPNSSVIIPPVYIEDGAMIENGAVIGPNVAIHTGAKVGAGCALVNCVVMPGSVVQQGLMAKDCLI